MMVKLTEEQLEQIYEWTMGHDGGASRYPGQSYEEGIRVMVDLLRGDLELGDVIDD